MAPRTPRATARSSVTPARRAVELLSALEAMGSEPNRTGMARYGINVETAFGVSVVELRKLARQLGVDHRLALALWATGKHEARLLACFVDDPAAVTERQADAWARDFDSWDVCDQACTSLFDRTSFAWTKAMEWGASDEQWVKRGGFALMAGLASHDRVAPDRAFAELLPVMARGAFDERNYVKKAVSWAMRSVGKRNPALHAAAVACAAGVRADTAGTWRAPGSSRCCASAVAPAPGCRQTAQTRATPRSATARPARPSC